MPTELHQDFEYFTTMDDVANYSNDRTKLTLTWELSIFTWDAIVLLYNDEIHQNLAAPEKQWKVPAPGGDWMQSLEKLRWQIPGGGFQC